MTVQKTALETWSQFTQSSEIVRFFEGLFEKIGVVVIDTGERLTAVHTGDSIHFFSGLRPEEVDYVVSITSFQVNRLAREIPTGTLSPIEQHRVIRTLFTPATHAILANSIFNRSWARKLTGAESVIQVILDPLAGEEGTSHTLEWTDKGWKVSQGLHGSAERVYHLNTHEALVFQKRALALSRAPSLVNLFRFAWWYRSWRRSSSSR